MLGKPSGVTPGEEQEMKHGGAKPTLPNPTLAPHPSNSPSSPGLFAEALSILSRFLPSPTSGESPGAAVSERLSQAARPPSCSPAHLVLGGCQLASSGLPRTSWRNPRGESARRGAHSEDKQLWGWGKPNGWKLMGEELQEKSLAALLYVC